MPLTRRMFAQLVASALLFRHLPAFAQTPLTVAIGDSPKPEKTQRVVSAGAPADMLLLAVAPEKLVGLSSFDFSRQTAIPFNDNIRTLLKLGRLAGRASTLSLEALLALKPDLVIDCGNADETWLSQARQVSAQTHIPWLLINGELRHA
ncbi:iron ABC transporter substrate-binding protein, partial [Escherichia coli]